MDRDRDRENGEWLSRDVDDAQEAAAERERTGVTVKNVRVGPCQMGVVLKLGRFAMEGGPSQKRKLIDM
jgi:hypothetical protein